MSSSKIIFYYSISGICTTQDVDLVFKHMNNARYLRELDFARFHYYDRSGIFGAVVKQGGGAVQGASTIRYRRAIPLFTPYKITTKVQCILLYAVELLVISVNRFTSSLALILLSECTAPRVTTAAFEDMLFIRS